ncbi:MAG: tetratricopeptide repeat protein [Candidatus Dormibacteraeota bacterium]|nr:tetratricopeptide repeat protein [Candidatus Dormibacteraeota bacterium]MBV9524656.1 tetratricopeptide repeat protein [Candidatus Dormibacteraeota bacterium]
MADRDAVRAEGESADGGDVEILLLGSVEARRRGRAVELKGTKQRTLLAALALEANHVVTDDRLIELLWPEEPPAGAEDVLRVHVSKLRRAIEEDDAAGRRLLARKTSGYQLSIPADHIDLSRCRELVGRARRASEAGDDQAALRLLEDALALWRGDPLPEFGNDAFAVGERSALEKLRLETVEQRFDTCLRLGLHNSVVGELEAFAGRFPLRERLQSQLMLALYRCGRQAEASDVYHRTRKLLSEDLGMEPGPELQARFKEILNQEPSAAPAPEVARPRPQAAGIPSRRHNLPARLSSFVGREEDVAVLAALVPGARLLSLVGPGGIGKTRLAIQVADLVRDAFADGVWLVDLAAISEPGMVAQAALAALGLRQLPGASLEESLSTLLEERRLLLVLDNCEHVIDAVAATVQRLLDLCPGLSVLATSQERLDVPGERVWPVTPLRLPAPEHARSLQSAQSYESVRLFVERAVMARPTFQLSEANAAAVMEVCTRLDGIPLAIELAAARVSALALEEMVGRLDDRFRLLAGSSRAAVSRHRTMRETLDWSSALLTEQERALFARLGVFSGSFTLRAVEAVCGDETALPAGDVPDLMTRLVDRSLVTFDTALAGEGRYRLLETMREYVQERLAEGEAPGLRRLHAVHYLELGRACERVYVEGHASAALQQYHADYSNARAAMEWSYEADPLLCLELAGAWRFYWWMQGLLSEGRQWLERVLALPVDAAGPRAQAMSGLGRLVTIQGDVARAVQIFKDALPLAESAGDDFMVGELTHSLGVVSMGRETNDEAERYTRAALAMWERVGFREGIATALGNLGECCFYAGNYDEARARYLQQVEMAQEVSRYYGLVNLSHLECFLGNYEAAREYAAEALRHAPPLYAAVVVEAFMFLAAAQEQAPRAATLSAAVARLYAQRGAKPDPSPARDSAEARLRDVVSRLDEASLAEARRRGADMSLDEVTAFALGA